MYEIDQSKKKNCNEVTSLRTLRNGMYYKERIKR